MQYGLSDKVIERIQKIFENFGAIDKVILFGSRAKGNFREGSDIDLAVKGIDYTFDIEGKVNIQLDDLNLPYKIDLINYHSIKEPSLNDHIDRVGIELYSRWKEYKIADIVSLEYGKSLLDYRAGTGKYDVFGTNGKIGTSDEFIYNKPSVIIGRKGAYRETHLSKKPFFVIDTAFYTKNKSIELDTIFLYYWFKNINIIEMDSGLAIPSTSRDEVYNVDIKLPPLSEQTAIAAILSSLDDKIDLLQRQNKTLEQIAETLFKQWFVEQAEAVWKVGTLHEIVSVKGGTTPSTSKPEYWGGNINWTSPRDLSNDTSVFLFHTEKKITSEGLAHIGSGLLPIGTVLLSSRAPIGYLTIIEIPVAINQGYIAIECNKIVSNYFIYLWCKTNMKTIENAGNGSVFQEISKTSFKGLEVVIPSKELLSAFDKEVEPIFQKIKSNQIQIRTLTQTVDNLLPKLMSGEIRVSI